MPNKRRKRDNPTVVDITPERAQHGDVIEWEAVEVSAGAKTRARNRTQRALDRYLIRDQISQEQFDVGMKLYGLWRLAGGPELQAAGYEPKIGPTVDIAPIQADARRRMSKIMQSVGNQLSPVLVSVCICDEAARDWALRIHGAPQAGIVVLRLALNELAGSWR